DHEDASSTEWESGARCGAGYRKVAVENPCTSGGEVAQCTGDLVIFGVVVDLIDGPSFEGSCGSGAGDSADPHVGDGGSGALDEHTLLRCGRVATRNDEHELGSGAGNDCAHVSPGALKGWELRSIRWSERIGVDFKQGVGSRKGSAY